jgi:hypothetical protein
LKVCVAETQRSHSISGDRQPLRHEAFSNKGVFRESGFINDVSPFRKRPDPDKPVA